MIVPKIQFKFCPKCKTHTEHTLEDAKRKPIRTLARGQRRFLRKMAGYGGFPKENPKGREKPTRKQDWRFKCKQCGKAHPVGVGFRTKKIEKK